MTISPSRMSTLLAFALAAMIGLATAPLARAQDNQTTQPNQSAQQPSPDSKTVVATGCLQRSSTGSGFQLIDQTTSQTWDLTAQSSEIDLSAQVGHTVTVTGNSPNNQSDAAASNPSGNAAGGNAATGTGAANAESAESLTVTNVKMVSSSCQSLSR